MSTLFQQVKSSGGPFDNNSSDLYIPDNKENREILDGHTLHKENSTSFRNNKDGEMWIDIPFAYDPYWESKGMEPA